MWMPALFFLPLLSCHTRRLFLEAEDPVDQRGTQLTALRWVQLVGVRGSSIHCGLKQVDQRAAEGVATNTIFGFPLMRFE